MANMPFRQPRDSPAVVDVYSASGAAALAEHASETRACHNLASLAALAAALG